MSILRVDNVGSAGFIPDVEYWQLDANAWTMLRDARLSENSLYPPYSTSQVFPEAPYAIDDVFNSVFTHQTSGVYWYVMCSTKRVYASRGGRIFDITPDNFEFSGSLESRWQAESFNGFLILNNARNEPYYWPITTEPGQEIAKLKPLSSYPGESPWPAGQTCEFIVGFNNCLFAGNIRDVLQRFPYLILFSDFAEPGTLPQKWTPQPDNSAGSRDLAEGQDEVVAGSVFRDQLIVRKRNSVVSFRFIGGQFVYQRQTISNEVACVSKHAIANSDQFQLCVADNDIFITTGQSHQSVVKNKTKRWFFDQINKGELSKIFTVHNSFDNEVWIVAPTGTSEFCDTALIWNYSENTFTTRTCNKYLSGSEGYGINPDGFLAWGDLEAPTPLELSGGIISQSTAGPAAVLDINETSANGEITTDYFIGMTIDPAGSTVYTIEPSSPTQSGVGGDYIIKEYATVNGGIGGAVVTKSTLISSFQFIENTPPLAISWDEGGGEFYIQNESERIQRHLATGFDSSTIANTRTGNNSQSLVTPLEMHPQHDKLRMYFRNFVTDGETVQATEMNFAGGNFEPFDSLQPTSYTLSEVPTGSLCRATFYGDTMVIISDADKSLGYIYQLPASGMGQPTYSGTMNFPQAFVDVFELGLNGMAEFWIRNGKVFTYLVTQNEVSNKIYSFTL